MSKTYNLFISHSWAYSDSYEKLSSMLDNGNNFSYKNYSVPRDDPVHNAKNASALSAAIQNQMTPCHVIIVLAGVYATYSKWILKEINLAQMGFDKPKSILAIQPFGSERTSTIVKDRANEIVAWNTNSIVSAIRRLG